MNRQITYEISKEYDGKTVKDFLLKHGYSHPVLVQLKKTPRSILRHEEWLYFHSLLQEGDSITVFIAEESPSENIVPNQIDLDIIYEDEDIILINKSCNVPIHPSMNNYDNSLANGLMYYYRKESSPFVYRCINRLDKDTSGLTLVAKNPLSAAILYRDMTKRLIKRTYYALVEGVPEAKDTINAGIRRVEGSTIMRCIDSIEGEPAITHYKRLQTDGITSLVECVLETGRTHQIRVHMSSIGHPLLGDYIYNPNNKDFSHQALHAGKLEFVHPITKKELTFSAPFPSDFLEWVNHLTPPNKI